jgi:hypothetical protein
MRYAVALLQLLQQIVLLQLGTYTLREGLAADEVCSRGMQQVCNGGEVCSRYAIWRLLQVLQPTSVCGLEVLVYEA